LVVSATFEPTGVDVPLLLQATTKVEDMSTAKLNRVMRRGRLGEMISSARRNFRNAAIPRASGVAFFAFDRRYR
jgi:hypothetical protein